MDVQMNVVEVLLLDSVDEKFICLVFEHQLPWSLQMSPLPFTEIPIPHEVEVSMNRLKSTAGLRETRERVRPGLDSFLNHQRNSVKAAGGGQCLV
jgi:hypothetical protein